MSLRNKVKKRDNDFKLLKKEIRVLWVYREELFSFFLVIFKILFKVMVFNRRIK